MSARVGDPLQCILRGHTCARPHRWDRARVRRPSSAPMIRRWGPAAWRLIDLAPGPKYSMMYLWVPAPSMGGAPQRLRDLHASPGRAPAASLPAGGVPISLG